MTISITIINNNKITIKNNIYVEKVGTCSVTARLVNLVSNCSKRCDMTIFKITTIVIETRSEGMVK